MTDDLMVSTFDGRYAVCLDRTARFYHWVMWKHPDGHWVSERPATDAEIYAARAAFQARRKTQ